MHVRSFCDEMSDALGMSDSSCQSRQFAMDIAAIIYAFRVCVDEECRIVASSLPKLISLVVL